MTPTELRSLGEPHGHGWQTKLARGLGVHSHFVRRWLAGKAKITPQMDVLIRQYFGAEPPMSASDLAAEALIKGLGVKMIG